MKQRAAWFLLGGLSIGSGTWALSGPGDLTYRDHTSAAITSEQGACYTACAVADGSWDGEEAGAHRIVCARQDDDTWRVDVVGLKTDSEAKVREMAKSGGVHIMEPTK